MDAPSWVGRDAGYAAQGDDRGFAPATEVFRACEPLTRGLGADGDARLASMSTFEAVHEPLPATRRAARADHARPAGAAQQEPPDDRRLVLPGPLRPRRHQGDRRHVGAAAPAHRPADGDLAVRGAGPAHRQPRLRPAHPARPAQRDDRRPRHLPRGGLPARGARRCCTACSCGCACPTRCATDAAGLHPPGRPADVLRGRRHAQGAGRRAGGGAVARADVHPAGGRRDHARARGRARRCRSTGTSSTACSPSRATVVGRRGARATRWPTSAAAARSSTLARRRGRARTTVADAARRRAVRGGDRDVVELHRPQPRGGRRAARGLERRGRRRGCRRGSAR